jgi:hypothetical protein
MKGGKGTIGWKKEGERKMVVTKNLAIALSDNVNKAERSSNIGNIINRPYGSVR